MNGLKEFYRKFSLRFHPDSTDLDKKMASDIFARGSYLYKVSPRQFLNYCKEGDYLTVPDQLFKLLPKVDKNDKYFQIEEANRMFALMEKKLDITINPLKFDNIDQMMEHLIRLISYNYIELFKKIRKKYDDINKRIFMYERLDFTVQVKFLEEWKDIYTFCVRKCRSIYDPAELVQVVKSTKGNIPMRYISLLFSELNKGVSDVIESV
jgi:hypothetical protein